jgi:class 3 adenylate cyclase
MTRENESLTVVRKLVVVFDISSSTTILEDLLRCERLDVWRNALIALKEVLMDHPLSFEIYKFMGDGWILLFPEDTKKDDLFEFLNQVKNCFLYEYQERVEPVMQANPQPIGLTFGIDSGVLIKMEMNEQPEYLGRAINVAARLQGQAKGFARDGFSNIALMSKASFNSLSPENSDFRTREERVELRNITGGEHFQCFAIEIDD